MPKKLNERQKEQASLLAKFNEEKPKNDLRLESLKVELVNRQSQLKRDKAILKEQLNAVEKGLLKDIGGCKESQPNPLTDDTPPKLNRELLKSLLKSAIGGSDTRNTPEEA